MKLTQLRHIAAIVELGSLRGAARHLELAQPLLTRSLRDLERELGVELFERDTKGMTLTAAGQLFHRRASAILNEVRRARDELSQVTGEDEGTLVAGLSIMPYSGMLPKALPIFMQRYPKVQLSLIEGLFPALEGRLRDGSLDFYLGASPLQPPAPGLSMKLIFHNNRAVVGRCGHPMAAASSLRDLVDASWATTAVDYNGNDLAQLFAQYDLPPPRVVVRASSAFSLMVALAQTDLLTMLPTQWSDFPLTSGALQVIPIKESLPAPDIVLIRRAHLPLTPAAEHLVDLMLRWAPAVKASEDLPVETIALV